MPIKTPKEIEALANARANKINRDAQKRILLGEALNKKAVHTAIDAWLVKGSLAERQAFLEMIAQYAEGIAAERTALFASTLEEAPEAAPVPVEAPSVPVQGREGRSGRGAGLIRNHNRAVIEKGGADRHRPFAVWLEVPDQQSSSSVSSSSSPSMPIRPSSPPDGEADFGGSLSDPSGEGNSVALKQAPATILSKTCSSSGSRASVDSNTHSNSRSSSLIRAVQRSGRMSSSGEDFLPARFFIRYPSQDCTTLRPETSNSHTSGATGLNLPSPTVISCFAGS
jgi:hypothetical protein